MDDDPARAIRTKKNSSIVGAMQLVKDNKASAVFSAGSTGASLVAAISVLRENERCNYAQLLLLFSHQSIGEIVLLRLWRQFRG